MRLSDIQPQYFPRLHYFARMMESDLFLIRDDVQFVRNHKYPDGTRGSSYQAHTPIRSAQGKLLLTVPVTNDMAPLNVAAVSYDQPWARKHLNIIKNAYGRAPHFARLMPELETLLGARYANVAALNIATTCWALGHLLGREPVMPETCTLSQANAWLRTRPAGRLKVVALGSETLHESDKALTATERIVKLCGTFGADTYVSGKTAMDAYLDLGSFRKRGIEVSVQNWRCEPYEQCRGSGEAFLADLSILDLLMNMPAAKALPYLQGDAKLDDPAALQMGAG